MDYDHDLRRARAVLAGDAAAFDAFFGEYFPRLYRYVLPRVGHTGRGRTGHLPGNAAARAAPPAHLSRRGGTVQLDLQDRQQPARRLLALNRRERERVVFGEDDPTVQAVLAALQAGESDDPERQHSFTELCRVVQATLDNLPGRFGDALEWKYLDGLPVAEIAQRLGLSTAAAQSLLQRARAAFREAFTAISEVTLGELLAPQRHP